MALTLPNFLDVLLNNPAARTSTDGVPGGKTPLTAGTNFQNGQSSFNRPLSGPAVVTPPAIVNALTPNLGLPSAYQSAIKMAVGDSISATLQTANQIHTGAPAGMTNIGSPQYTGNVATQLFSGIRGVLTSQAPAFGISANAGPIANGMAVMANAAVRIGQNAIVQKYGSAIVTASQYVEFGSAVLNSFNSSYDNLPEVQAVNVQNQLTIPYGRSSYLAGTLADTQLQIAVQGASAAQNETLDLRDPGTTPYTNKVYLVSSLNAQDMFLFVAQPVISVSETAAYSEYSPIHAPGQIMSYKNSPSRTFSVSDFKLISRNMEEATTNLEQLHLLRGWTKPYFGRAEIQQPSSSDIADNASAPPLVISGSGEQGANADIAQATAVAAEISKLNRSHPLPVALPVGSTAIKSVDAVNQSISPSGQMATMAAASARKGPPHRGYLSGLIKPVVTPPPAAATQGVTATASTASINAPITPTAESAQVPTTGSVLSSFGSPPEVLYLYGYSNDNSSLSTGPQNLRRIPVVIASIGFSYPNDVDYIPTKAGIPFPTVMAITLELKETKSPYELEQFSLADYRAGKLIGW